MRRGVACRRAFRHTRTLKLGLCLADPLAEFAKLFGNVFFLVGKRADKHLDFESYRRKHKATKVDGVGVLCAPTPQLPPLLPRA